MKRLFATTLPNHENQAPSRTFRKRKPKSMAYTRLLIQKGNSMQQPKDMQARGQYPNHIKRCIKRQGYTLQEVADEVGISRRTLTSYVTGEVPTPRNCLEKIAYTIGCDLDELVIHPTRHSETQPSSGLRSPQKESIVPKAEQEHDASAILLASQITPHFLLDQTINERLDNAESMIDLSWEAWFASRPKKAAGELNKLL